MCPNCQKSTQIIKKGFYRSRSNKSARVQRYRCKECARSFSDQTGQLTYREHKPHINQFVLRMLGSGMSQRRAAAILGVHPITIARKLVRLDRAAHKETIKGHKRQGPVEAVVFDEMETFEHTKCKPLSLALAVEDGTRRILSIQTSQMPAKGRLAEISRRKYGYRKDHRRAGLDRMFEAVKQVAIDDPSLKSDQCPRYPAAARAHFPGSVHTAYKGRRAATIGQGELKRGGHDPLFSLNHTAAMYRDNVKTLARRTWCTVKRPDRLQALLNVYAYIHNELLEKKLKDVRIDPGPIW